MVFWDLGLCLDGVSCSVAPGALGGGGGWFHWDVDRRLQTFLCWSICCDPGFLAGWVA